MTITHKSNLIYNATVTRRREAAGHDSGGSWVPGVTSDVTITASVQPLTGEELKMLDEGQRSRRPIMVITDADLQTVDETARTKADRIVWDGEEFEIHRIENFEMGLMAHREAICLRADR